MKSVKKIIAVAIAVLLIMAVSGIALAAPADTTQAPEQNLIASATSYTIPKDIVVFNAAGMNIFEPNITYSYEVTPVAAGASVTDKDGNPRKVKFKKMTYLDLANTFGKSSPDTAYQTVHRAYAKMREWLKDTEYFKGE